MQIACNASFRGPHLIWSSLYEWPRRPRTESALAQKSPSKSCPAERTSFIQKCQSVKTCYSLETEEIRFQMKQLWIQFRSACSSDTLNQKPAQMIHWIKIESCEQSSLQTLFSEHEIGVIGPIVEFDKGESTSKNTFGTLIERGTENILEFKYFPLSPSCRCLENASGQLRFLLLRLS